MHVSKLVGLLKENTVKKSCPVHNDLQEHLEWLEREDARLEFIESLQSLESAESGQFAKGDLVETVIGCAFGERRVFRVCGYSADGSVIVTNRYGGPVAHAWHGAIETAPIEPQYLRKLPFG